MYSSPLVVSTPNNPPSLNFSPIVSKNEIALAIFSGLKILLTASPKVTKPSPKALIFSGVKACSIKLPILVPISPNCFLNFSPSAESKNPIAFSIAPFIWLNKLCGSLALPKNDLVKPSKPSFKVEINPSKVKAC